MSDKKQSDPNEIPPEIKPTFELKPSITSRLGKPNDAVFLIICVLLIVILSCNITLWCVSGRVYYKLSRNLFDTVIRSSITNKTDIIGFSVFSITWFAGTAIASTILTKITTIIASEIRLSFSRYYIVNVLASVINIIGINITDLMQFIMRGTHNDNKDNEEKDDVVLPVQKILESLKEILFAIQKGKE